MDVDCIMSVPAFSTASNILAVETIAQVYCKVSISSSRSDGTLHRSLAELCNYIPHRGEQTTTECHWYSIFHPRYYWCLLQICYDGTYQKHRGRREPLPQAGAWKTSSLVSISSWRPRRIQQFSRHPQAHSSPRSLSPQTCSSLCKANNWLDDFNFLNNSTILVICNYSVNLPVCLVAYATHDSPLQIAQRSWANLAGLRIGFHSALHVETAILEASYGRISHPEDSPDDVAGAPRHALRYGAVVVFNIRRHSHPKLRLISLCHLQETISKPSMITPNCLLE